MTVRKDWKRKDWKTNEIQAAFTDSPGPGGLRLGTRTAFVIPSPPLKQGF
jgi:hypothetical protein